VKANENRGEKNN